MMDEYEKHEQECDIIREDNKKLLKAFAVSLKASGLTKSTIDSHCSNLTFFLNTFLLYVDPIEAKDGHDKIGMLLGYWFISKAMWSSAGSIKANATSLKKFYAFLYEKGQVKKADLDAMKQVIKKEMPDWLATMKRYEDPSVDEVW